jgi:uncharacterized protein YdeI (YjbR/CyaY-like superfamily)
MKSFSAKILIIGINPYVYLPETVLKALFEQAGREKGPIPVKGKMNGKKFKQTVVKYQGTWRLYLNTAMREAAGVEVGDIAQIEIDFDSGPRTIKMNPKLEEALSKNKKAKQLYEKLPPSHRKDILQYLNSLKTPESVEKNVKKVLAMLK